MIYLYYAFAALLIFLSFKSFRGGLAYRRYLLQPKQEAGGYTPFASVIAPYKGLDEEIEVNLAVLFSQHYPAYEIIFVVDDERDPAAALIRSCIGKFPGVSARLVITDGDGQGAKKAQSLREAVTQAAPESRVLLFVDSDARVSPTWLADLVTPLSEAGVGAATGYRWFVSEKTSFANELVSTWNASIASALGPNRKSNFCWGGSTAIRRDDFERLGIREKWRGIVSDDFVLTRAVRDDGGEIVFVSTALCASPTDMTLGEVMEFTTRQMKITRVYRPDLWLISLIGAALFCSVTLASLGIVLFAADSLSRVIAALTLITIAGFSVHKSYVRAESAGRVINDETTLRRHPITHSILFALTPPLFLANSLAALFSRTIVWRGTTYEMVSRKETKIHKHW